MSMDYRRVILLKESQNTKELISKDACSVIYAGFFFFEYSGNPKRRLPQVQTTRFFANAQNDGRSSEILPRKRQKLLFRMTTIFVTLNTFALLSVIH